ncbi:MAG: RHS repeat-associated core domain-containing protein [Bacteroidia bacterium]
MKNLLLFLLMAFAGVFPGEEQARGEETSVLIHMNGRLYDPVLGRMLSPDNYIQAAFGSQGYNRYSYAVNNPLRFTDPSGEWVHIVAGALIGGTINWVSNGSEFSCDGLKYFGIGALAGGLGAGIRSGVGTSMAGGNFFAGFAGSPVSATGFITGATSGTASGLVSGFISGTGNSLMKEQNLKHAVKVGLRQSLTQGIKGFISGGIQGGADAVNKDLNFFTGTAKLDLSSGVGAHNISNTNQTITGKYVGSYEGVNVYESKSLGSGSLSGGITLPGYGITVGKGVFSQNLFPELMQHEFGHILQSNMVGLYAFYKVIGIESLASASRDGIGGYSHNTFWTETWANYLSQNYFGNRYISSSMFPIKNINWFDYFRLRFTSPFFWP